MFSQRSIRVKRSGILILEINNTARLAGWPVKLGLRDLGCWGRRKKSVSVRPNTWTYSWLWFNFYSPQIFSVGFRHRGSTLLLLQVRLGTIERSLTFVQSWAWAVQELREVLTWLTVLSTLIITRTARYTHRVEHGEERASWKYGEEHQERRVFHKWFIIAHHLKKWRTWSAQEPVLCQGPRSPHRAVVDEVGSAEKGGKPRKPRSSSTWQRSWLYGYIGESLCTKRELKESKKTATRTWFTWFAAHRPPLGAEQPKLSQVSSSPIPGSSRWWFHRRAGNELLPNKTLPCGQTRSITKKSLPLGGRRGRGWDTTPVVVVVARSDSLFGQNKAVFWLLLLKRPRGYHRGTVNDDAANDWGGVWEPIIIING